VPVLTLIDTPPLPDFREPRSSSPRVPSFSLFVSFHILDKQSGTSFLSPNPTFADLFSPYFLLLYRLAPRPSTSAPLNLDYPPFSASPIYVSQDQGLILGPRILARHFLFSSPSAPMRPTLFRKVRDGCTFFSPCCFFFCFGFFSSSLVCGQDRSILRLSKLPQNVHVVPGILSAPLWVLFPLSFFDD